MVARKTVSFRAGQVWEGSDGWKYKVLLVEDDPNVTFPVVARRLTVDKLPLAEVESFDEFGETGTGYRLKKLVATRGTVYVNVWQDGSMSVHVGIKDATLGGPTDRGALLARSKVKWQEGKFEA